MGKLTLWAVLMVIEVSALAYLVTAHGWAALGAAMALALAHGIGQRKRGQRD